MNKPDFKEFIGVEVCDIDNNCPTLRFNRGAYLIIECCWRLLDEASILIGSGEYKSNHRGDETHDKLKELLVGNKIKRIRLGTLSDLFIEFEERLTLELYNDSGVYESWTMSDGKGQDIISLPGGELCFFK